MTRKLIFAAMALVPAAAFAQFDFGGGASAPAQNSSKPWSSFKLPSKKIKLDFRNASVDMILNLYQKESGVTIVKDPALTDRLSITSAKDVSISDAFQILSTTLSLKGFDMSKEGNLIVIKKREQRGRDGQQQTPTFDPSIFMNQGQQASNELRVYPVQYAAASQLARVLNEVFVQQGGGGFGGFPIQFQFGGQRGGNNNRGNPFQNFRFPGQQSGPSVRASADDFSNSVVVSAPRDQHRDIQDLIKQLDKQTDAPQRPVVYKLNFAAANDVATTVSNVLTANAPKGRGQTSNQQQGGGFFGNLFGNNQNRNNNLVSPDVRSNSVIVTATDENHSLIKAVIEQLDQEVPIETSTVVIPLENARADDVAGLLNQAFGQRQGTGQNRGNLNNQNRANQNRNNRNTGGNFGAQNLNDENLYVELQNPNADEGELLTKVGIAGQFGFFGGQQQFGGQNNQNRQNAQTARDAQGRIVNVQDLTGQVTTIPDPNTNSIIVVTTPQGADLIRGIIDQLDRIPEQVMIETMIVEASLDESTKLGFQWDYTQERAFNQRGVTGNAGTTFPDPANSQQQGFRYTLTGGNLNVTLDALKTDDRFQILSTPRIFTSNNVEAQINISQSVPYVTNSRQDPNGGFIFNYAFEDVGIVLTVTPRITSNGYVTMQISQTANDLQGFTDFNAPIINQRQADTQVSVKDGETIVLGGIIRNSVTTNTRKVPLLGDIPILGELFKSTTKDKSKTELIVFLTPRVVKDSDDARMLRERVQGQMSKGQKKEIEKELGRQTPPPAKNDQKTGGEPQKTGNGGR
jgi:general secretion pathway protein D